MTARLTNPIGTRLGLSSSWRFKVQPNTKSQILSLFKREQTYNRFSNSLFRHRHFKKQTILRGNFSKYYTINNILNFDVLLYDTAYERVRRNIKFFRKYTAFNKKIGGQYYRFRNIKIIQQNRKFIKHPLITRVFNLEHKKKKKKTNLKKKIYYNNINRVLSRIRLNKKKLKLKLYTKSLKRSAQTKRQFSLKLKFIKMYKVLSYYFGRATFLHAYTLRLTHRISKRFQVSAHTLKINLVAIPKLYVTIHIIMALIIKRLYLNYTLLESIKPFRKYLKLRTLGYILRGCGKLTKKQRAWYVKKHKKQTKINNLSEYVTYKYSFANLKYGTVGIKLWINY